MKNLILILTIFCFSALVSNAQSNSKSYGEKITTGGAVKVSDLAGKMGNEESMEVKASGTIVETCRAKGCWMTIDLGEGEAMRVTFKDYGFFVPTDGVDGKTATFEGTVEKSETSVAVLKHYAEDAGKSQEEIDAITEPKTELTFVAAGVVIEE